MEGHVVEGPDAQSLNDIQSYLVNFNKEISAGGQTYKEITAGGQTYLLATSDTVTGQQNFVIANPSEQLYTEENGILQAVEGQLAADGKELELDENKLKVEAIQEQLEPAMLQDDQTVFTPIHIAPSQATAAPEPLFQAGLTAGEMVAQPDTQLITVQPGQAALQPGLVAIQGGQQRMVAMTTADGQQIVTTADGQQIVTTADGQQIVTMAQPEQQEEEEEEEEEEEGGDEEVQLGGEHAQQGDGNYQTVTIVPSEVNQGGEVSYVLIVSQNDQDQKLAEDPNIDMSVYDFKEENRVGLEQMAQPGQPITPSKIIKGTPKKATMASQNSTQLMCNYCNYTSPKRYLLTRHMKTHSEERPHKCHICDRGFKTVASLQNHINTHTGVRPHKCKECDSAFTTSGELVRHVRYRHTYEKPHKCPECDYASVELSKLKRHMRSHTGERPYQCPHCTYASPDTYKLKRHLRIHTGEKPYECDICHTRFTQSNSLKAHKLIHTGNKPVYQCELCPTTCGRKTDLKIHVLKLHTSEKPLQCKKCGKSFPDRYTWKIHVKTHEGEKCFKCELCPYAALSQRHLESHLLTHTGEKPFECDECEQSFRQKQLLRRHKNLYHNPDYVPPPPKEKIHECPECGKAFAHKGNLLRHRAGHDPDNSEFQEALATYRAEQGEDYDEEAEEAAELDEDEEPEEEEEEQHLLVTQAMLGDGQGYQADPTGQVHLANINGQQVQLQLVNLNDENNTQVYIQIDNSQHLQNLMEQQVTEGAGDMEVAQELLEVQTPPGPPTQAIRRIPIKEEDMKEEELRADDGTPSKRRRMDSPRQEGVEKVEQKRKDIETCFGFEEM